MRRFKGKLVAAAAVLGLAVPMWAGGGVAAHGSGAHPTRVMIVLFDQMVPQYADQFKMPNFRKLRGAGTNFKNAHLGYMASETVIAHNVITSGQLPKHMGWVDEAYRDAGNLLGKGVDAMHITGDLSLADFGTLVNSEGYPKLADYLHTAHPGTKFITVGEKSYAVESATASSGDIAVRLSSRKTDVVSDYKVGPDPLRPDQLIATGGCRNLSTDYPGTTNGRWRYAFGKNVPDYLLEADPNDPRLCGRFFINSDSNNDYGTKAAWPSFLYPEDGNRFFPGTDASAMAGHVGGDTWVADAAIEMMNQENWSGMFVTMGAIDKAGHMWGAQADAANFTAPCATGDPVADGAAQTHVRCAAENADLQLGKLLDAAAALDASDGGETLFVLTADHGATYGEKFYGKMLAGDSDSNWYYAPVGVYDAGVFVPPSNTLYNRPSPALQPLIDTGNIQFSYQSTAIETWLINHSVAKMKKGVAAMLRTPGVIAGYWHDGSKYRLFGTNAMTSSEKKWWKKHGQEIVDTMAASNGPDIVGLLHDRTSYGVYGDHGGATESVQRVPMVFWSPSLAFANKTGEEFTTPDVMPTILDALGIRVTAPLDGEARDLDD
jgi:hypothetical protein